MNEQPKPNLSVEFGLLGVLALLWGSAYLFTKTAVAEIPPLTLIASRVTIAAIFLIMLLHWRNESLPRDGGSWRKLFVQSFFNSMGAWTILAWGQQHIDSGLAAVLSSTSPIFVFFITMFATRHEAISGLKLIGACLGLCGVVMIVGADAMHGISQQVFGQLTSIATAILYALAAIYGRHFSHLTALATAAGTMIWASLILIPASLLVDQPWSLMPSWKAITSTLILAVFCTAIALLIYFRLLRTLGSLGVASQSYLRSGVGVLLGVLLLGEQITPVIGLGLLATILGVAAMNFTRPAR